MKIRHFVQLTCISACLLASTQGLATTATTSSSDSNTSATVSGAALSDQSIVREIKHRFSANKEVSGVKVEVNSQDGTVDLSGHVATDDQASVLVEIAESVPGVKDVDSPNLVIKSSKQPFTDSAITAKVKGTFVREEVFGKGTVAPFSIHVETKNGEVFLTGTADNQTQIDNAVTLSKAVKGVKNVDSKVTVKQ